MEKKNSNTKTSTRVRYAFGKKIFIIALLALGCFLINSDYQNRKIEREELEEAKNENGTLDVDIDFFYTPYLDRIIDSYDLKWSSKSGYDYDMKMENDFVTDNVYKYGFLEGEMQLITMEVFLPYPSFSKIPEEGVGEYDDIYDNMTDFEKNVQFILKPESRTIDWNMSKNYYDLELFLEEAKKRGDKIFVSFRYTDEENEDYGIAAQKRVYNYRVLPDGYVMYYSEEPFREITTDQWAADHFREFFYY